MKKKTMLVVSMSLLFSFCILGSEVEAKSFNSTTAKTVSKSKQNRSSDYEIGDYTYRLIDTENVQVIGFSSAGDGKTEVSIPKTVTIEGEEVPVTSVGQSSFTGKGITKVDLTNIQVIGNFAFQDNNITELDLPNATYIGPYSFKSNQIKELTDKRLPKIDRIVNRSFELNTIERVSLTNVKYVEEFGLAFNENLTELHLPELISTGEGAFEGGKLTSVEILNAVSLGPRTFSHNKIERISGPNVEHLGWGAFYDNPLKYADFPKVASVEWLVFHGSRLEEIHFPSVKNFGDNIFMYTTSDEFNFYVSDELESSPINPFQGANIKNDINLYGSGKKSIDEYLEHLPANMAENASFSNLNFSIDKELRFSYKNDSGTNEIKLKEGDSFEQAIQVMAEKVRVAKKDETTNVWSWEVTSGEIIHDLKAGQKVQWYKANSAMAGQNSSVLTMTSLKGTDTGEYYAIVDGKQTPSFNLVVEKSPNSSDSNALIDVTKDDTGMVKFSTDAEKLASIVFNTLDTSTTADFVTEDSSKTSAKIALIDTRNSVKAANVILNASASDGAFGSANGFLANQLEIEINPTAIDGVVTKSNVRLDGTASEIFTTSFVSGTSINKEIQLNPILYFNKNELKNLKEQSYGTYITWTLTNKV